MAPRGKPGSRSATRKAQKAKAAARAVKNMTAGFETIQPTKAQSKQIDKNIKKTNAQLAKSEAAKKAAATRAANKSKAANKAAMKAAAKPVSIAKVAGRVAGRAVPLVSLGLTAAEIAMAMREAKKVEKERRARGTRIAKESAAKDVKVPAGRSPTDVMRQVSKGREVLAPAKRAASKYKVKAGDTLSQIAKKNGTTVRAIMKASGIENANKIKVGQQIRIPDDAKRKGPYGGITKKELKSGQYNTDKTPKFGADFKYGGSMGKKTTKKKIGGKIGRGCGAATKGGGAVTKY